jgi:SAM-dependent methyltransferase
MDFRLKAPRNDDQSLLYEDIEYHDFWEGIERQHLDKLEQIIVSNMLKLPARRLIDIGCGFGRLAQIYGGQCQEVVMLDSSWSQLQQAQETTDGRFTYVASDATSLPFRTGSFDRTVMVRVFHHIEDSQKNLSELHRILCKQGQLLFTYSNKRNVERLVKWTFGKLPYNPFDHAPASIWEMFIMHHPAQIRESLLELGFSNMSVQGSGIMDKIAGRAGKLWKWVPLGVRLAPLFGKLSLAPWIFVEGEKTKSLEPIDEKLPDDYLVCPKCQGDLELKGKTYRCMLCDHTYQIKDGIIDFRDE